MEDAPADGRRYRILRSSASGSCSSKSRFFSGFPSTSATPVHALAVVLFSLILFTGLGSLAGERVPLNTRGRLTAYALALSGYLIAVAVALPFITHAFQGFVIGGRIFVALVLLAPAGLFDGAGVSRGHASRA
ncbi:MAG: hypothetical protein M5R36_09030 [Deltaproteobacteria bacterium]|nr:hypothetical protein [Deltaproteobacteria bacterium]